jgi:hypothetical protein
MTYPYVEHPGHHDQPVAIWLDDSWLMDDRDIERPAPDFTLTVDEMNAVTAMWLQGPPGPRGARGATGPPGYPLDIDVMERLRDLEDWRESHQWIHEDHENAAIREGVEREDRKIAEAKAKSFWPERETEEQEAVTDEHPAG